MKPKSDLCAICQKNYTSHSQLRGASDEDKSDFFFKCQEHLRRVDIERAAYKSLIKRTVDEFDINKTQREESGKHTPNSYDGDIHYSFDFAQQIHIPFDSLQPGPIYFLTPFKVGLFGVFNDTLKVQHNFIIPESCSVAKGANSIVSYLHYYFENHGLGEKNLYLHADNCVAQNKNNIVTCYLTWRILHGLNKKITLSFLPVGHTKFACDWAFGLIKKKVRVDKASCLADVVKIVNDSTPVSKVNQSILTGDEQGQVHVPLHDWLGYFAKKKWKPIKNITTYNHFEFNSDLSDKGKVTCQNIFDGPKTKVDITSDIDPPNDFPPSIVPEGLSWKRKKYLFEKIRPFCAEDHRDLLCADPGPEPNPIVDSEEEVPTPKPNKKRKKEPSAETLTNKPASSSRPSRRRK